MTVPPSPARRRVLAAGLVAVLIAVGIVGAAPATPAAAEAPFLTVVEDVPDRLPAQVSDPVDLRFRAESHYGQVAATAVGLPPGLSLVVVEASPPFDYPSTASWSVVGTVAAPPGDYPVEITVTDGNTYFDQVVRTSIAVAPESAGVTYTGPPVRASPSGTPVAITARVDQEPDGTSGDLTLATVTVTDTLRGEVLCAAVPVDPSGAAACAFTPADLPASGRDLRLRIDVGGWFAGTALADLLVDGTAPETTIATGPADGSLVLATSTSVGLQSDEPGASFACRLDGASVACPGGRADLADLAPRTHVFTASAVDRAGNVDPTPASRTFTVPADERDLDVAAKTWQLRAHPSAYGGYYFRSSTKGAALRYRLERASSVSVLVGTGPRLGKVRVLLDGKPLRTISLRGAASLGKVVAVAAFAAPRSGTLTLRAVSGKQVWIDGLAVTTAP